MKVSVFGLGYLGACHAAGMARMGHEVVGVEPVVERVAALRAGRPPFFEPGLSEALTAGLSMGRLRLTIDPTDAIPGTLLHFVCVGTPEGPTGAADVTAVEAVVRFIAANAIVDCAIAVKSSCPVGTARRLLKIIAEEVDPTVRITLLWNPEFVVEGSAMEGTLAPDRIVIGEGKPGDGDVLIDAYRALLGPAQVYRTTFESAELIKATANAFLATKISFVNAVAELCEVAGGDVAVVAQVVGADPRIGSGAFTPGLGYGGGCLPKDVRALRASAQEHGADGLAEILRLADMVNAGRRQAVTDAALAETSGHGVVAMLGAAFKQGTDDVRDSPALEVAVELAKAGRRVRVYDPHVRAAEPAEAVGVVFCDSVSEAVTGADLAIVATPWQEFRTLDPARLGELASRRRILDARQVLEQDRWEAAGWTVLRTGLGRR